MLAIIIFNQHISCNPYNKPKSDIIISNFQLRFIRGNLGIQTQVCPALIEKFFCHLEDLAILPPFFFQKVQYHFDLMKIVPASNVIFYNKYYYKGSTSTSKRISKSIFNYYYTIKM